MKGTLSTDKISLPRKDSKIILESRLLNFVGPSEKFQSVFEVVGSYRRTISLMNTSGSRCGSLAVLNITNLAFKIESLRQ